MQMTNLQRAAKHLEGIVQALKGESKSIEQHSSCEEET